MAGEKMTAPKKEKSAGSSDDNIFGALCYLIAPWVSLFILFTDKKSNKFLAFHAWQAIFLIVAIVVFIIGLGIVNFVVGIVAGPLALCVLPLYALPLVAILLGLVKAFQGEMYKMPVLGEYAEKQAMK